MAHSHSFDMEIKTDGLTQFDHSIDELTAAVPGIVSESTLGAARLTIKAARPTVPVRSGKTADSLRAYATGQTGIAEGGNTVDHYRWLELGGRSGRHLKLIRSIVTEGRYIHPGYEKQQEAIQALMNDVLNAKVHSVGLS